jgi:hypothetical protein
MWAALPIQQRRNNSRQTLLGMLRQLAAYVQMSCNNDQATLLGSGFEMQSTTRTSAPLEQPESLTLKNGSAGQLVAAVEPVRNANIYEGRIKQDGGDWLPSVFSGDSQHIIFSGRCAGKITPRRFARSAAQPDSPIGAIRVHTRRYSE